VFDKTAFKWIKDYYLLIYQKRKFVLFHYPILEWDGFFHDSIHLYGHVHNGDGKPGYMEQFRQLGKRAVNVGVDVQGFHPVSIEEIIRLADGEPPL
jgi:calcineurin-like phosphoesterase family protein